MRPKEVDVIIEQMGVTYEELASEDFGGLKVTDILMDRNIFTEAEWKEIEKEISTFIDPSLSVSIPSTSAIGLSTLSNSAVTAIKRKQLLEEEDQESLEGKKRIEQEHKEELAKILEQYEQEEKLKRKVFSGRNETESRQEKGQKHPFELFEEEGSRIVDAFRKFDMESKFVVTKYFETKRHLLTISNFEKGVLNELNVYLANARQNVSAVCSVEDMVGCGLESGSVVFLRSGEGEKVQRFDPIFDVSDTSVSCLDMTSDKKYIVAGYQNGCIVFWDAVVRKVIKCIRGESTSAVVQIKIYSGFFATCNGPCCISSNALGDTSRIRLDEKMFMFFDDYTKILKEPNGKIHQLVLTTHFPPNGGPKMLLLGYASESMIMVLCVEPESKSLYQFDRPSFVRERSISHVGWGTGSLPNQGIKTAPDQTFLVGGWGKHIFLFLFDGIKGSLDQAIAKNDIFRISGLYEHPEASILYLAAIGVSRLALLDGDKKIHLLFTGNFKPIGKSSNSLRRNFGSANSDSNQSKPENTPDEVNRSNSSSRRGSKYDSNLNKQTDSNSENGSPCESSGEALYYDELKGPLISEISPFEDLTLKFHMLLKDPEGHPMPIFTNHVASQQGGSKLTFCDSNNSLIFTKIYDWQEYIERLIEDGEWLKAMTLALDLYKGRSKHFGDLAYSKKERKEKVREVLKDLALKYSEQALGAYKLRNANAPNEQAAPASPETTCMEDIKLVSHFDETICLIVIDILVSSKLFEFLFTDVVSLFQQEGLFGVFARALEPFILSQKIKKITDKFLKTLSRYYESIKKTEVIQALIMSLDPSKHDILFLLQICLEYKLFTTLIYICPRSTEPDFATPLIKLYSEARVAESHKDYTLMSQQLMRMLWYLNMTIKGEKFPHEPLDEDSHSEALAKLLPMILDAGILKFVLQEEPKIGFEVLLQIFKPNLVPFLYEMDLPKLANHTEIMKVISDLAMSMHEYVKSRFFLFVCDATNQCNVKVDLPVALETLDFFLEEPRDTERLPNAEEMNSRIDKLIVFLRQNESKIKGNTKPHELKEKAAQCP